MIGMLYHSLTYRSLMPTLHISVHRSTQNRCLNTSGWVPILLVTALASTPNGSDGPMSLHSERLVAKMKPFMDVLCHHLCLLYLLLPSKTNWFVESKDSRHSLMLLDHLDPANSVHKDKLHALIILALIILFAMIQMKQMLAVAQ